MKKILCLLSVLFCSLSGFAQTDNYYRPRAPRANRPPRATRAGGDSLAYPAPKLYLGIGGGLNSGTGILGVDVDVPVHPKISIRGGVGLGSWGSKSCLEGRYYPKPGHKGFAAGIGVSYASGLDRLTLEHSDGQHGDYVVELLPQVNIALNLYYFFRLGQRGSRFYLQTGKSTALTQDKFLLVSGQMSPTEVTAVNFISPGGLILAAGFSFVIAR